MLASELTLTDFFPLATKLAREIAWLPADEDDLVQEGMLELHRITQTSEEEVEYPVAFCAVILRRKMQEYYGQGERNRPPPLPLHHGMNVPSSTSPELGAMASQGSRALWLKWRELGVKQWEEFDDFEDMEVTKQSPDFLSDPGGLEEQIVDDLFLSEYLSALEESAGPDGRWIVENLLRPSDEFGQIILREMEEKKARMAEDPSLNLRGIEKARISHRQLRDALGLSVPKWFEVLHEIRDFTVSWFQDHGEPLRVSGGS